MVISSKIKSYNWSNIIFPLYLVSIECFYSSYLIRYIIFVVFCFTLLIHLVFQKERISIHKCIECKLIILLTIISGFSLPLSIYFKSSIIYFICLIFTEFITLIIANNVGSVEEGLYFYGITILLINVIALLFFRDRAFHYMYERQNFRSIFYDKNTCASSMLLPFLVFFKKIYNEKKYVNLIFVFLSIYFLMLTHSYTALVLTALLLILFFFKKNTLLNIIKIFPFGILFFLLYLKVSDKLINSNLNAYIKSLIGKDFSISGRTKIWSYCFDMIKEKWFIGYGYNAIWSNLDLAKESVQTHGYTFLGGHAHNGYIELLLSSGVMGAILMIILIITIMYKINKTYVYMITPKLELILLIYWLYTNFFMNTLFNYGITWNLIIVLIVKSDQRIKFIKQTKE